MLLASEEIGRPAAPAFAARRARSPETPGRSVSWYPDVTSAAQLAAVSTEIVRRSMFATATSAGGASARTSVEQPRLHIDAVRRGVPASSPRSPPRRRRPRRPARSRVVPPRSRARRSRSRRRARLPRSSSWSSSRQSCVVGCAPVPNARPGSITTESEPELGASQGGPIHSDPISHGPVEALPLVLPAFGDRLHPNVAEPRPQARRPCLVRERGQLDRIALAEPRRTPPGRARASRPSLPRPDRQAPGSRREAGSAERALQLLEEALVRAVGLRRWRSPRTRSRSRCCSSLSCRGTATFTSTRWSPRPKPWSTGIPLPAQHAHRTGLRAGLEIELELACRASPPWPWCRARPRSSSGRPSSRRRRPRARVARAVGRGRGRRRHPTARRARPHGLRPRDGSAGRHGCPAGSRRRGCASSRTRPAPAHASHGCSTI